MASARSKTPFKFLIKATFFGAFAAASRIGLDSCAWSTHPAWTQADYTPQCPLEPTYNACDATHFLTQDSDSILIADVIGIGERHSNKKATSDCIENLSMKSKKQTILLEGYPHGMLIPCTSPGRKISHKIGRICIGWDTEEYMGESILRNRKNEVDAVFVKVVQPYYKHLKDVDSLTAALDNSLSIFTEQSEIALKLVMENKQIPAEFNNLLKYMNTPASTEAGSLLATLLAHKIIFEQIKILRKNKVPYSTIANINQLKLDSLDELCDAGEKMMCEKRNKMEAERNHQLVKEIRKHTKKGHQVIAIAGAAHFIPGIGTYSKVPKIQSSVDYVRKELQKGVDANPFAILAIKEFEIDSLVADEKRKMSIK